MGYTHLTRAMHAHPPAHPPAAPAPSPPHYGSAATTSPRAAATCAQAAATHPHSALHRQQAQQQTGHGRAPAWSACRALCGLHGWCHPCRLGAARTGCGCCACCARCWACVGALGGGRGGPGLACGARGRPLGCGWRASGALRRSPGGGCCRRRCWRRRRVTGGRPCQGECREV